MKHLRLTFIALILAFGFSHLRAQTGEIDRFLESSAQDAGLLTGAYIDPFMRAAGNGLVAGWYNTGEVHKPLGFDLTVTLNLVFVPDEGLFYDAASLPLTSVNYDFPIGEEVPTVFGPKLPRPRFVEPISGTTFEGPGGLGLEEEIGSAFVPVPIAQLGIGLIKNTEIRIRYLPSIDIDDFSAQFFGLALKHDIKQHIPAINKLPFDLSVLVGFTKLSADVNLAGSFPDNGNNNQVGEVDLQGITAQVIGSKKFSILTLYGALGYNIINSDLAMKGTYVIDAFTTLEDPFDLSFDSNSIRFGVGFRIKLGPLTLHGDYTLQEYNVVGAGIGLSVR